MNDFPRLGAYLALFSEIGLVLFLLTFVVNIAAKFVLRSMVARASRGL